eukprot:5399044-Lingulodinium_polyedra.AAC.1
MTPSDAAFPRSMMTPRAAKEKLDLSRSGPWSLHAKPSKSRTASMTSPPGPARSSGSMRMKSST